MPLLRSATHSKLKLPPGDLWIFGYGSLMWSPGIPYVQWAPALVFGYHRALCIYSSRWRGTPERPGLVLGLDRGGACRGIAFRVKAADVNLALEALWEREMRRAVYQPRLLRARLPGRDARVLTFIADPHHVGYAGKLSIRQTARLVATCHGAPRPEYRIHHAHRRSPIGTRRARSQSAARARCRARPLRAQLNANSSAKTVHRAMGGAGGNGKAPMFCRKGPVRRICYLAKKIFSATGVWGAREGPSRICRKGPAPRHSFLGPRPAAPMETPESWARSRRIPLPDGGGR